MVHDRYQIVSELELVVTCQTKTDAFNCAQRAVTGGGYRQIWVHDAMAHKGKPEAWQVFPDGSAKVTSHKED